MWFGFSWVVYLAVSCGLGFTKETTSVHHFNQTVDRVSNLHSTYPWFGLVLPCLSINHRDLHAMLYDWLWCVKPRSCGLSKKHRNWSNKQIVTKDCATKSCLLSAIVFLVAIRGIMAKNVHVQIWRFCPVPIQILVNLQVYSSNCNAKIQPSLSTTGENKKDKIWNGPHDTNSVPYLIEWDVMNQSWKKWDSPCVDMMQFQPVGFLVVRNGYLCP